jgi:hypothetical protein
MIKKFFYLLVEPSIYLIDQLNRLGILTNANFVIYGTFHLFIYQKLVNHQMVFEDFF